MTKHVIGSFSLFRKSNKWEGTKNFTPLRSCNSELTKPETVAQTIDSFKGVLEFRLNFLREVNEFFCITLVSKSFLMHYNYQIYLIYILY